MTLHIAEIALCSNTKHCDICRVCIIAAVYGSLASKATVFPPPLPNCCG